MDHTKSFIEKMQKKLLAEKRRFEKELADFTVKKGKINETVFPEYGNHVGENASEVASFDSDVAVKNTLEKALRDVNASLKRIEDGNYGICKYCHKQIAQKRMEIRPTSSACIECKKKLLNK